MTSALRIGIDLGGTKIEMARARRGRRGRVAPPRGHARGRLRRHGRSDRRAGRGGRARTRLRDGSVGVAHARRALACDGRIKNANSTCLNGRALKEDLERAARRARCASPTTPTASRSRRRSTARRAMRDVVFGVILGTGVGGGIVVDAARAHGRQRDRRRVGPQLRCRCPSPRTCRCRLAIAGGSGCIETYLSGPGLAADHARR